MPTARKENQVEEIKDRLSRCTIAVTTGYQGLTASEMTELRRRLREQGIEYKVIKNNLALRAAEELGKEEIGSVLKGPTGMAFGYGDAVAVAKALSAYITSTRSSLTVYGAMMEGSILTTEQVRSLALLPPRDELLARLIGQMQAPIAGLVNVLSGPVRSLATVLHRIAEQGEGQQEAPVAIAPEGPTEGSPQAEDELVEEQPVAPVASVPEGPAEGSPQAEDELGEESA